MAGFNSYGSREEGISRRQEFAKLLREQSMTPSEGQMVSGRYVAPSWTQGLARLLQAGIGAREAQGAMDDRRALEAERTQALAQAIGGYSKSGNPKDLLTNPDTMEFGLKAVTDQRKLADKARFEGPKSREVMMGSEKVTQEYNPETGEWGEVARGAAFAPKSGPQKLELYKALHPEDTTFAGFDKWAQTTGAGASTTPANIQEWAAYQKMSPAEQEAYLRMKRGDMQIGLGDRVVIPGRVDPAQSTATYVKGIPPQDTPQTKEAQAEAAKRGTETGTASASLADNAASLPRLEQIVTELSDLGKTATYTKGGQLANSVRRQVGADVGEGGKARAAYVAKIDNEVLPLLRQTFGAAFTQKEGDSLKATLGDPDMSPAEKDAVLNAFIESKRAQIKTLESRTGPYAGPDRRSAPAMDGWKIEAVP